MRAQRAARAICRGRLGLWASLLAASALVGCSDELPEEDRHDTVEDGGGPVADGGGPVTDGGGLVTDGGGPVTDGGGPVADDDGSVTDGGGPVTDGGGPTEDAGRPAEDDGGTGIAPPEDLIDWVVLPGGTFTLGTAHALHRRQNPLPPHEVTLRPFALSRTLVTVAQYRACRDAGACPPARAVTAGLPHCALDVERDGHPVQCVNLAEAQAFAAWVGGRLPSEAEWEYAARSGGRAQPYPWGDALPTCARALIAIPGDPSQGLGETSACGQEDALGVWLGPVCARSEGGSAQGLCDLIGGLEEWTADGYCAQQPASDGAPARCDAGVYVLRGGHFGSLPDRLSAYARVSVDAEAAQREDFAAYTQGLRVARSLLGW